MKNYQADDKFQWVNIAKGLTIILMVLGHTSLPNGLSRWIWSFHMPFFFFISGLLTNFEKPISQFSIHKGKQLLIPFLWYSIIVLFLYSNAQKEQVINVYTNLILFGWGGIALWFVPVIYISLITVRIFSNTFLPIMILIFMTVGRFLDFYNIELPWTLSSVPFAAAIISTAYYFHEKLISIYQKCIKQHILCSSISFIGLVLSISISLFYRLDMACNQISPIIPIYIGAISGIFFILTFSILLYNFNFRPINDILIWCGKNTFEIMALSQVIIMNINIYLTHNQLIKYSLLCLIIFFAVKIRKSLLSPKAIQNSILILIRRIR